MPPTTPFVEEQARRLLSGEEGGDALRRPSAERLEEGDCTSDGEEQQQRHAQHRKSTDAGADHSEANDPECVVVLDAVRRT